MSGITVATSALVSLYGDMLAMSIWTKTNTNTTNNDLIVRSSGKQFLYGQSNDIRGDMSQYPIRK